MLRSLSARPRQPRQPRQESAPPRQESTPKTPNDKKDLADESGGPSQRFVALRGVSILAKNSSNLFCVCQALSNVFYIMLTLLQGLKNSRVFSKAMTEMPSSCQGTLEFVPTHVKGSLGAFGSQEEQLRRTPVEVTMAKSGGLEGP